jgi:phosphoribosylformylglycinamidine synthase subunit PurS
MANLTTPPHIHSEKARAGNLFAQDSCRSRHMKAKIIVTPKKAVLDPQGKTVQHTLQQMGYKGFGAVHVGKYLEIELPDGEKDFWRKQIDEACHRILSNPVIEEYHFEIE